MSNSINFPVIIFYDSLSPAQPSAVKRRRFSRGSESRAGVAGFSFGSSLFRVARLSGPTVAKRLRST